MGKKMVKSWLSFSQEFGDTKLPIQKQNQP